MILPEGTIIKIVETGALVSVLSFVTGIAPVASWYACSTPDDDYTICIWESELEQGLYVVWDYGFDDVLKAL